MTKTRLEEAMNALDEGRAKDAASLLEKEIREGHGDVEILVYLGIAYVQSEQPDKAVEVLTQAEEQVEDHCILSLFLGRAYKALGDYDSASRHLATAIDLDPQIAEAWTDLGEIRFSQSEYGAAVEVLNDAIERFPNEPGLRSLRAMALHKLGDYTEAAKEFGAAYELNPDSIIALTNYAYSMLVLDHLDEAAPLVEAARTMDPDNYRTLVLEAEYRYHRSDIDAAKEPLVKALRQMPDCIEILGRLAVVYKLQGDAVQSKVHLDRAVALAKGEPGGWQRIWPALLDLEEHERLVDCLTLATERDRGAAGAWVRLAVEYARRRLADRSWLAWKRSFELRGYVKVYCSNCNTHFRLPFADDSRIDQSAAISCINCRARLSLPECLSTL